jgi:hypothetical protein
MNPLVRLRRSHFGFAPAAQLDLPLQSTMSPFHPLLRSIQRAIHKRKEVTGLHFHTVAPTALALVGSIFAPSASTSASEVDPALDIQGSLGVSFGDLSTGTGATVFLLNRGCALR